MEHGFYRLGRFLRISFLLMFNYILMEHVFNRLDGFSRICLSLLVDTHYILFLSFVKIFLLNSAFFPKLSNNPTSISVARK